MYGAWFLYTKGENEKHPKSTFFMDKRGKVYVWFYLSDRREWFAIYIICKAKSLLALIFEDKIDLDLQTTKGLI